MKIQIPPDVLEDHREIRKEILGMLSSLAERYPHHSICLHLLVEAFVGAIQIWEDDEEFADNIDRAMRLASKIYKQRCEKVDGN